MSLQKVLIGTVSGILAGVAVGLLLAPAKGSETHQKIAESTDHLRNKLRNIRGKTADELDQLQEIFENEVSGLKDDVRSKILKLIEASKMSYSHIKDEAMAN